jgi:prolyl 4-hydroxylase
MLSVVILIILVVFILWYWYFMKNKSNSTNDYNVISFANKSDPYVKPIVIENFLSNKDCDRIIEYSKNKLFDSQTVGGLDKKTRDSRQHWINKNDKLVKHIYKNASEMFKFPLENTEDFQVVNYKNKQFFNQHYDACCDKNKHCLDFIKTGGQRVLTILIYLNDEFTGGYTEFPNLNLKIKPKKGKAVIFYSLATNTNKCHPYALHAGLPIENGEKWIANIWVRERKY